MRPCHLLAAILFTSCGLLLFDDSTLARGGTIRITTQAVARVEGDLLHLAVQVANQGSSEAYQVRAEAEALGERFRSQDQVTLNPGGSRGFLFQKTIHRELKGTYPLKVLVHFQDANGYPFSALTCTTFSVQGKGEAGMPVTAAPLTLQDHGIVQFEVHNTSTHTRRVETTLQLPNEFSSRESGSFFSLGPGEKRTLSFPIRNLSALYGAAYPVFLVQEYESGGVHSSSVSTALVSIVKEGNWFRRTRWYWAGGAVFLIGLLVALSWRVARNT
jgi:hypothetical protein